MKRSVVLLFGGCASKPAPGPSAAPVYTVGITSNGNVRFGEMATKKLGYATTATPVPAEAARAMLGRQLGALDKCTTKKTEISVTFSITELGKAQISDASGRLEANSDCIHKAVAAFRFPLGEATVAPLTLTIGK